MRITRGENNRLNLGLRCIVYGANRYPILTHAELRLLDCKSCNGDGEVKCAKCKGTGKVPVNCIECKGKGKFDSDKGLVECDICNGTGKVDEKCNDCFGGGLIMCEACEGTGSVPDK